jgi:hypothetical protein
MSSVILLALFFVQDFADFLDENSNKVIKLGINQQCNPVMSICSASIINDGEFQRISFSIEKIITTDQLSKMIQLPILVEVIGFDFEGIESIVITFMRLGEKLDISPIPLIADNPTHQIVAEKWNAIANLPIINNNRRDWLAVIHLKSTKKEYQAEFPMIFNLIN